MRDGRWLFGCIAAAVMLSLASVREGTAQVVTPADQAAAQALEEQAGGWLGEPARWRGVARALERAAELRGAQDPVAVQDLFLAAAARFWVGDRNAAQVAFTRAAEWSLYSGDVENAALAFSRAAVVAFERKDVMAARELRDRAVHLARSPLLTAAQRQGILGQFTETPTAVASDHN